MSKFAIETYNLSKRYRLIDAASSSANKTVLDYLISPYKRFKEIRSLTSFKDDDTKNIFWALKDINLKVEHGDVIGLIGKNGAGKSTLLKILSKITAPTTGKAILRGRVNSLLEVGTGFNGELTGRENIYMNGTLHGMSKKEIDKKLDEIIDFAGVEKFIDIPVKRYSSGMGVRLGFAVAAHLEPEILIVDEVLAVGDAEFQKKAIGKMQDVSQQQGRTVIFVSHNMTSIENLCTKAFMLETGKIVFEGNVVDCINKYQEHNIDNAHLELITRKDRTGNGNILFEKVVLMDKNGNPLGLPRSGEDIIIRMYYHVVKQGEHRNCRISCEIHSSRHLMFIASTEFVSDKEIIINKSGYIDLLIENFPISKGSYFITLFMESNSDIVDYIEAAHPLDVIDGDFYGFGKNYPNGWNGHTILIKHKFLI
ncbi:MAG: ABC transporter ATP-binding protein [Bacteroidales bacterium]|nr:ABC transporter ATP-binding protein [Bacteroidales bacterium]